MSHPIRTLGTMFDRIPMYRVVVYGLTWLVGVAVLLSGVGVMSYDWVWLVFGLAATSVGCAATNQIVSRAYDVPSGHESSIITTLILFLILKPAHSWFDLVAYALVGLIAMVSKYVATYRHALIFNPAAFAVFVASTVGLVSGAWWVASTYLLGPVVFVATLVLRKTRRFGLFTSFVIPAIACLLLGGVGLREAVVSFPLIFLGAIMLTEPATLPVGRKRQLLYGGCVGLLVGLRPELFGLHIGPIEALLIGNLAAAIISRRSATMLTLVEKVQLTPTSYEFIYEPERSVRFRPGQFAEFTLPAIPLRSSRGNRRTFTIASAPGEADIRVGVKFYEPGSAYKHALFGLRPGQRIAMNHIGGDFVVDATAPSLCIAGGIGITPFISTIRAALAAQTPLPMTLVYFTNGPKERAYHSLLEHARRIGVKPVYVSDPTTRLTEVTLAELVPNLSRTHVYISGPPAMVRSYKPLARHLGARSVHTDYFYGY